MMYTIEYSKEADCTLRKWKKSNPQLFKKATKILLDIMRHLRTHHERSASVLLYPPSVHSPESDYNHPHLHTQRTRWRESYRVPKPSPSAETFGGESQGTAGSRNLLIWRAKDRDSRNYPDLSSSNCSSSLSPKLVCWRLI